MNKTNLAYLIGVAMGDGNLSNPNGKAVRLRITCDTKYPKLIDRIISSLKESLPKNKISIIKRQRGCVDISCYSNSLENLLGWKSNDGPKEKQEISVHLWIQNNKKYTLLCLKGLFETDGSVYTDRKYKMVNFVTIIPSLANDVVHMIEKIGFKPNMQILKQANGKTKHTIRIFRNVENFIMLVDIDKS